MADNVAITAGSGTTIAADDVSSVYYQRVKLDAGGDGATVPVVAGQQAMAASVPVVVASDQTALAVTVATVPSHAVTNAGTFAVQVDGAALTALQLIDNIVSGNEAQVDVVGALPAGTATIGATMDAGPAWTSAYLHTASADATGGADLTAAPTSGQKICIDDVIVSVDTAMKVILEEETSGTDVIVLYMSANSTAQVTPRGKIKLPTADKKLRLDTSVSGNIAVTVVYHSEA